MSHPLLEEFCRANSALRPEFFRRCQRVFREEVLPLLHDHTALTEENASLRAENTAFRDQLDKLKAKSDKRKAETVPA